MRIDYTAILQAIRQAIVSDTEVERHDPEITHRVYIERPLTLEAPSIFVYRERRDAPEDQQRLSQGRRVDYDLQIAVWVTEFDMDSVERSSERCDALLGKVELALLNDRTLGGTVNYILLQGGEFISGEDNQFYSAAEIALVARTHAMT